MFLTKTINTDPLDQPPATLISSVKWGERHWIKAICSRTTSWGKQGRGGGQHLREQNAGWKSDTDPK